MQGLQIGGNSREPESQRRRFALEGFVKGGGKRHVHVYGVTLLPSKVILSARERRIREEEVLSSISELE